MGTYEFRYVARSGGYWSAVATARQFASARGIHVYGDPHVTSRRRPIPLIGPKREFFVRFEQATRTDQNDASS
jgi:hypothetical protein